MEEGSTGDLEEYLHHEEEEATAKDLSTTAGEEHVEQTGGAGIPASVANLSNTILGAGMLGMPFAVYTVGLGFGMVLILLSGTCALFGLHLLACAAHTYRERRDQEIDRRLAAKAERASLGEALEHEASVAKTVKDVDEATVSPIPPLAANSLSDALSDNERHQRELLEAELPVDPSYYAVAKITYPYLTVVIDLAIAVKCFGVATSYLIVVGDLMPDAAEQVFDVEDEDNVLVQKRFWVVLSMLLLVPLSFLPTLRALKFTSVLALGTVCYLVGMVVGYFFYYEGEMAVGEFEWWIWTSELLAILPVFVFGYTCHQNLFPIYSELKRPSMTRINLVIGPAVAACFVIYQVVGVLGYLTFVDGVTDNIINDYPSDTVVTIGRIMVTLLVIFSYPLQVHPCRNSVDKIFAQCLSWAGRRADALATVRYVLITVCILMFTLATALFVNNLDVVFALVGATGSTIIGYILPGLFYFKLTSAWSPKRVLASLLSLAGCCLMVVCVTYIVYDGIEGLINDEPAGVA